MLKQHELGAELEITAENVRVPNEGGNLDAILSYPSSHEPLCAVVVAGPHPLLGGDMQNNVVTAMANGLATKGFATLRFNYMGVGGSDGPDLLSPINLDSFWQHGHTEDEDERWKDLDSAVQFLRNTVGSPLPLGVVAYSFGNFVTASWLTNSKNVAGSAAPDWLVSVAPTVEMHDMRGLAELKTPKLVIAPADDFTTSLEALKRETQQWVPPLEMMVTKRDGHFFRGHESWLCEQCYQFASNALPTGVLNQ